MSLIRKIIGFIPALVPVYLAWLIMSPVPATSEIYRTPLYRPADVPWFIWLCIVLSVTSGILLCVKKCIPAGLLAGILPHAVLLVVFFSAAEMIIFFGSMILFYICYGLLYYTYHREADKG